MRIIQASGQIDDAIIFAQFLECLDSVTKKIVDARRAEQPNLTFKELFNEIDARFTRNSKQVSRSKLEQLSLKSFNSTRMTMKEFEAFDAEFRLLKTECSDMSEDEAKRLFEKSLPKFLIEKIQAELLKREDQPTVFMKQWVGSSVEACKVWLEQILDTEFARVTQKGNGALIQCNSPSQTNQLLALDGRMISDGRTLQFEAVPPLVTFEEMRNICRRFLRPRESADEIKSVLSAPHS